MTRAAPSKTACVQLRPSIWAEELQSCIDEQKVCHREVWTHKLRMLVTTDPYLSLCFTVRITIGIDRGETEQ